MDEHELDPTETGEAGADGQKADVSSDTAVEAFHSLIERSTQHPAPESIPVDASLLAICRAMGAGLHLSEVLDKVLQLSIREMNAGQGSILLFDEHQDRLQMLASHGLPEEIVSKGYIPRKGSIAEWVIEHEEPLILNERAHGDDFNPIDDDRKIVSSMCVPLKAPGGVLGTINLNRTDARMAPFSRNDLDAMDILTSQAAIYIENTRLHEANLKRERLAAIGQTVAGISHCVKNLVTGMRGGVTLCKMARQNEDWETHDQAMEVLGHSVNRISALVMDMLEYSKDREPDWESVNLDELLKEINGVIRTRASEQGTEVVVRLAEDAKTVRADGHRLFRCLLNLVENALDANGEAGSVTIASELTTAESALHRLSSPAERALVITVSDEGPGISEENYSQIFEPFFSTKGSRGTGLGLAVVHKIISEHGGKLELTSAPAEPAVFSIYLPA